MTNQSQQATKKPRIAIYGGAFDPVHIAHVEIAKCAYEQAMLDQLIFMPAAHSPLKSNVAVATDEARLAMLELAIEGMEGFSVSDAELKRSGVSYTIDTVEDLQGIHAGAELFWIIGGDQFAQLDRWCDIDKLVRIVTFLVLARPAYDLSPPTLPELVWTRVEAPLMHISSTMVRDSIALGETSYKQFLPAKVEAFIRKNALYR